jgi:hypothetical protein
MSAPTQEAAHRWLVVTGNPTTGFSFSGPFATKGDAEDFVFDELVNGCPDCHVAKLYNADDSRDSTASPQ